MSQEKYQGDVLPKIAGLAFIVGGVLTLVFNALFPRADDPSVVTQVLQKLADNETLSQLSFLGIAIGIWALMMGTVGVYRNISTGGGAAWARMGFYGVIVGTTLFTISSAIGLAAVTAAVDWGAAGSGVNNSLYSIAAALQAASFSIFDMTVIVFWLALSFMAIGMVLSSAYPKWLGWILLVLSVVIVGIGFPQFFIERSEVADYIFAVPAGLTSVWALIIGIWMTRREIQAM